MQSSSSPAHVLDRPTLLGTTAGKLASLGALAQVPAIIYLAFRAFTTFPHDPSEELAGLAFLHAVVIASLFACWFYYGLRLGFKNNKLQNLLLVLMTAMPFFPTFSLLGR